MAKVNKVALNSRVLPKDKEFIEKVAFDYDLSMSDIISKGALREAKRIEKMQKELKDIKIKFKDK